MNMPTLRNDAQKGEAGQSAAWLSIEKKCVGTMRDTSTTLLITLALSSQYVTICHHSLREFL
jgi:hypothetical protein